MKAVRWGIATNIVWAWVITIPAAAAIAWLSYWILHLVVEGS
jgi:inorganic phosphate transporter, PiT family